MAKKIIEGVIFVVAFAAIWALFDFLWCLLISHTTFSFEVVDNIVKPVCLGAVLYLMLFVFTFKKNKDK